MTRPDVLLMSGLHESTQREPASTWAVHRHHEAADTAALLASIAGRCEVVLTSGGRGCEAAVTKALPRLRLVACCGVGVDAIDLGHARAHGIAVTDTPDVPTDDVADLAVARRRVGIVGLGRIGQAAMVELLRSGARASMCSTTSRTCRRR